MRSPLLHLALFLSVSTAAQWPSSPNAPLLLCDQSSTQTRLKVIPDGTGGWYALWLDDRAGLSLEQVYGQHVDSEGQLLWEDEGRLVQGYPGRRISSYDATVLDNGDLFVAAVTATSGFFGDTLRAMAYDSEAAPVWPAPVLLAHIGDLPGFGMINSLDDARVIAAPGAALIAWYTNPFAMDFITLSRVRNDGTRTLPVQGGFVSALNSSMVSGPWLIRSDGAHGVIVERRIGNGAGAPLRAMRMDSTATARWTNPVNVSANSSGLGYAWTSAVDADARTWTVWENSYDQRMAMYDTTGTLLNGSSPIEVVVQSDIQENAHVLPVAGSTYVSWADTRSTFGGTRQIFMQRLDGNGAAQLAANGVPVLITNHEWNGFPLMVESDPGSVIHAMPSSGTTAGTTFGLRAMRTDEDGLALWPDTVRFSTPTFAPGGAGWLIFSDGDGGAAAFWKSAGTAGLYAAHLDRDGLMANTIGLDEQHRERGIRSYPNPANDVLRFDLPTQQRIVSLECLDATGRRTTLPVSTDNTAVVSALSTGAYTARIITAEGAFTARFIKH
jgi:hypothetical protein